MDHLFREQDTHAEISRRTALRGLLTGAVISVMPDVAVAGEEDIAEHTVADPLLDALDAYRAGLAMFSGIDEKDWSHYGGEEAAFEAIYLRRLQTLEDWDAPAKSRQGALGALRFALDEALEWHASGPIPAMLSAAIAYLEKEHV